MLGRIDQVELIGVILEGGIDFTHGMVLGKVTRNIGVIDGALAFEAQHAVMFRIDHEPVGAKGGRGGCV